eukprot:SAG11_NODE_14389_length_613_cov_2.513619_1_plen_91_part_10
MRRWQRVGGVGGVGGAAAAPAADLSRTFDGVGVAAAAAPPTAYDSRGAVEAKGVLKEGRGRAKEGRDRTRLQRCGAGTSRTAACAAAACAA